MRWDRFFEDLQDQFDAEWEAERAVLDTEAERLRLSKVSLRERLIALAEGDDPARLALDLGAETGVSGQVSAVGADWLGIVSDAGRSCVVPLGALLALAVPHADLLRSARPVSVARPRLAERMTIGFVLRDLARRRVPVTVVTRVGRTLTGTIDRAGADHLDLALHDQGAIRRADAVHGYRLVPFEAIAWLRIDSAETI